MSKLVIDFTLTPETGDADALRRGLERECEVEITPISSFTTLTFEAGSFALIGRPIRILVEGGDTQLKETLSWLHKLQVTDTTLVQPDVAVQQLFEKALSLRQENGNKEALRALDIALKIQPGQAPLWCNRANALVDLGRVEDAEASYRKALGIEPGDALTWFNFGLFLQKHNRLSDARSAFSKAVQFDPNLEPARQALAVKEDAANQG